MKTKIVLCCLLILSMGACHRKEKDPAPTPPKRVKSAQINKIKNAATFTYTPDNTIKTFEFKFEGNQAKYDFKYVNGAISTMSSVIDGVHRLSQFTYDAAGKINLFVIDDEIYPVSYSSTENNYSYTNKNGFAVKLHLNQKGDIVRADYNKVDDHDFIIFDYDISKKGPHYNTNFIILNIVMMDAVPMSLLIPMLCHSPVTSMFNIGYNVDILNVYDAEDYPLSTTIPSFALYEFEYETF